MEQRDKDEVDGIYHSLVDVLPEGVRTASVLSALGMLLSTIVIEHCKNRERRGELAEMICKRVVDSCKNVPSYDELAAGVKPTIPDEYQTRH